MWCSPVLNEIKYMCNNKTMNNLHTCLLDMTEYDGYLKCEQKLLHFIDAPLKDAKTCRSTYHFDLQSYTSHVK